MKLIKTVDDLDNDAITFHPEFTHQLFGDTEMIFGYKGLKIKMYYSASKLRLYFDLEYTDKVDPQETEGIEADDVISIIKNKLELKEYFTSPHKFAECFQDEKDFKPYGKKIDKFVEDGKKYETFFTNHQDKEFIVNYHEQMQHFLLWFIDGASYIDNQDERWEFFTVFEKIKENDQKRYYFVGYATVYCYWAYPSNIRPRISQVLILPQFQKKNIGYNLLQKIYMYYNSKETVTDITVEDPSDNFSQLRNYTDCFNCLSTKEFQKENLMKGWSKELAEAANKYFKINRLQARKIYEILKLYYINRDDPIEYKNYRLEVKARLNAPLLKRKKKRTRFYGEKPPKTEIETTPREVIIEELAAAYNELEKEYLKTIERLKKAKEANL